MDKLEGINKGKFKIGKWFRLNNLNNMVGKISESGLVLFFDVYDFTKSLTPEYRAYVDYPKGYGNTYTDLTLTPKEALILLANRFELEHQGVVYHMIGGCIVEEGYDETELDAATIMANFNGFTIHALPKEPGNNARYNYVQRGSLPCKK